MAIDDNTVYGLTGAQVKELANKVKATEDQVVFLPMTITDLQTLTFSMDNTVAEINAMINAGISVFYRLVLPQAVGGLQAGTYDFRPFYSSNVAILCSMVGAASTNTIMGIAWHTASGTPYLEMRTIADTQAVTNAISDALVNYYSKGETNSLLNGKADAPSAGETYVTSSELQTISDELANKVDSSDLSTVATSGAYSDLTGVPSNIVTDANYVHTDNNFTTTEKNKLSNIQSGAEANVQSDWNQTTTTADDYIKNKPSVPVITMTTTDPGEGSTLAANHFIAVYN